MKLALGMVWLLGCGDKPHSSPARAPGPCDDYHLAIAAARQNPGDVAVELRNGCGCPAVLRTTEERAARARDALAHVIAAKTACWVNCDQPCQPNDSRW